MKKIFLLLVLLIGVYPYIKQGQLQLVIGQEAFAGGFGDEEGEEGGTCYREFPATCGHGGCVMITAYDCQTESILYVELQHAYDCSENGSDDSGDPCDPYSSSYNPTYCSNDPCDPYSASYNPTQCNGDPCDPYSMNYNPSMCDSGDPCDPYSAYYNPSICNDSGDPCDYTSSNYNPAACSGGGGGVPDCAGVMGGSAVIDPNCGCIGGTTGLTCPPCPTSKEDLDNLFPNASDDTTEELKSLLNKYMEAFGIDTKEKLQHFLAQAGHETGGFNNLGVTENLNYSADGLLRTWPTRFSRTNPNMQDPDDYAHDPEKIANFVYGNRMGNTESDDGYQYRGRGIFQLTGKSNYQEFKIFYNNKYDPDIDLISNPDLLVSNHELSVVSALWFYQKKVLDKLTVNENTSVKQITLKINGGDNGIVDRKTKYDSAKLNIDCNN